MKLLVVVVGDDGSIRMNGFSMLTGVSLTTSCCGTGAFELVAESVHCPGAEGAGDPVVPTKTKLTDRGGDSKCEVPLPPISQLRAIHCCCLVKFLPWGVEERQKGGVPEGRWGEVVGRHYRVCTLKQPLSQNPHISPKVGGVEWGHDASDPDYRSATRHQYPHQSASVHRA